MVFILQYILHLYDERTHRNTTEQLKRAIEIEISQYCYDVPSHRREATYSMLHMCHIYIQYMYIT